MDCCFTKNLVKPHRILLSLLFLLNCFVTIRHCVHNPFQTYIKWKPLTSFSCFTQNTLIVWLVLLTISVQKLKLSSFRISLPSISSRHLRLHKLFKVNIILGSFQSHLQSKLFVINFKTSWKNNIALTFKAFQWIFYGDFTTSKLLRLFEGKVLNNHQY